LLFAYTNAQTNLVPNPSFEIHDTCPTNQDQITYATGWSVYRAACNYLNSCASYSTGISVPSNLGGYQYAACGNAYMGLYSYFPGSVYDRGSIGCLLNSQLTIGTKYYVSFKASLSDINSTEWYNTATNNLGVLFSTVPYSFSSPSPINNFAHVYSHTIITDTLNWVQVLGSFVADSAYKYLAIGNFFDNAHTNKTYFFSDPDSAAFYFIDEVCVSTDSAYTSTWNCTMMGIEKYNTTNAITIYPNPCQDYLVVETTDLNESEITVCNILGEQVFYTNINTQKTTINTSPFNAGVYFFKIKTNTQENIYKVIINQ
jgi:hypothetical protein